MVHTLVDLSRRFGLDLVIDMTHSQAQQLAPQLFHQRVAVVALAQETQRIVRVTCLRFSG